MVLVDATSLDLLSFYALMVLGLEAQVEDVATAKRECSRVSLLRDGDTGAWKITTNGGHYILNFWRYQLITLPSLGLGVDGEEDDDIEEDDEQTAIDSGHVLAVDLVCPRACRVGHPRA